MTFLNLGGFMEFMRIGGGLIGILIAILVIPAYRKSLKDEGESTLGNKCGTFAQIAEITADYQLGVRKHHGSRALIMAVHGSRSG